MSSTPAVSSTTRLPATIGDTPGAAPADTPPRASRGPQAVEVDRVTQQPVPLRFPWLSRLAQQLEPAAPQKPAFPSAPVLGDHVDRSA